MSTPIADLHCDTLLEIEGGADLAAGAPEGHVDLPRLRAGRLALQFFAAFVPSSLPDGRAFRAASKLLDVLDDACDRWPGALVRARTADEVEAAVREGKTAAVAAVENGHAIEASLAKLDALAARGVRYMTLTHARHLRWAASSGEPGDGPGGLTAFGRAVVKAMNDLGVVVDVSHVHRTTFFDVVRCARRPFIASHSCAAALCPLARNLDDEQLRAIAGAGGVVGINFYPGFLDADYFGRNAAAVDRLFSELERIEREAADDPVRRQSAYRALVRESRAAQGPPAADLDRVCEHIEHVLCVAGPDHVAFGSDFDGIPDVPRGVPDCSAFPRILQRLGERGHGVDVLERIAWRNVLRVLRAAEA